MIMDMDEKDGGGYRLKYQKERFKGKEMDVEMEI